MVKGVCVVKGVMHGEGDVHGKEGGMCGKEGMHGKSGVCVVKGACMVKGGHAWRKGGGVCGMHAPSSTRYGRSMRGRYASYWNAFLFPNIVRHVTRFDVYAQLRTYRVR